MPRLSTSSWSLHRALGGPPLFGPGDPLPPASTRQGAEETLLTLPHRLAKLQIHTLEIVHFHFPTTADNYLAELKSSLQDADVALFSILIDAGDITQADEQARQNELNWIRTWIDVAAQAGASCARVVAGYSQVPLNEADELREHPVIQRSAAGLRALAEFGAERGVKVITENFRETAGTAARILAILELCEGEVGLCADFGNFKGSKKYDELAAVLPQADSVHAKGQYPNGALDREELERCLNLLAPAHFNGPISLIFDAPLEPGETEWQNLAALREIVAPYT